MLANQCGSVKSVSTSQQQEYSHCVEKRVHLAEFKEEEKSGRREFQHAAAALAVAVDSPPEQYSSSSTAAAYEWYIMIALFVPALRIHTPMKFVVLTDFTAICTYNPNWFHIAGQLPSLFRSRKYG